MGRRLELMHPLIIYHSKHFGVLHHDDVELRQSVFKRTPESISAGSCERPYMHTSYRSLLECSRGFQRYDL